MQDTRCRGVFQVLRGVFQVLPRDLGLFVVCCRSAARDSQFPASSPRSSAFGISCSHRSALGRRLRTIHRTHHGFPKHSVRIWTKYQTQQFLQGLTGSRLVLTSFPRLPIGSGSVFLNGNNQLLGRKKKNLSCDYHPPHHHSDFLMQFEN